MYVSREQLLAAIQLLEKEDFVEALGGTIRYRELTGQEVLDAKEAALADEDHPDNDVYKAMIVAFGMLEPKLSTEDVFILQKGRNVVMNDLANRIMELGEALPGAMKSGDSPADDGQSDAHGSLETAGDDSGRSPSDAEGSGPNHVGADEYAATEQAA